MARAMVIAAVMAAGAWTVGTQAAPPKRSCCAPAASCCVDACCADAGFVSFLDEKPAAKEVKLTGTLVCGSCKLNQAKKCSNVLQVTEKGKTVNYWLIDKGNDEAYHEGICGGGETKNVTVVGVVSEKDGKKWVKASKVDAPKK